MLEYIITFFQVLFEELDKLLKPKPTAEELEEKRRLNILYNFWTYINLETHGVVKPSNHCRICQIMYRCCPLSNCEVKQRRRLPYKETFCPANTRLIVQRYK